MTRILLIPLLCILFLPEIFGQSGEIRGIVMDSLQNEAIELASVRLYNRQDTLSYVKGMSTDKDGKFSFAVDTGRYTVDISFLGYENYMGNVNVTSRRPTIDLGVIYLKDNPVYLEQAVVTAKVPDIVVKGDTIEYNAGSYSMDESDLLQDIIKRIPGIEVDSEGRLMANGKPITKIMVDGKEFFGNDIQMALKNLPANMINKLQLYKEESETSKITGFKDGKEQQVLNLQIKEEFKQSIFGDVKVGYGSDEKYVTKGMLNYMRSENQLSLIGEANTIMDNDGFGSGFYGSSGEEKHKNVGLNFSKQKSDDFRIGGNIRYSDDYNLFENESRNEYLFENSPNRINNQFSSSANDRKNLNIGLNSFWKPDSLTTVYFRLSGGVSQNKDNRTSQSSSYLVNSADTTKSFTDAHNKGDGNSLNGSLTVGRQLDNKGRVLSLSLNGSFRNDNSTGVNYSRTAYGTTIPDEIIDQHLNTDNDMSNWGMNVSYVEPLSKHFSLQLSYSINQSLSERVKDAYRQDEFGYYTVIDTAYTRNTRNDYTNQNFNVAIQTLREKYELSFGVNIDPSHSVSKVSIGDSIIEETRQRVTNFSPNIRFVYKPENNINLNIDYYGSTMQPALSQLSSDTTIYSAMYKMYGNPNLKPSYNNNINVYYQKSDFEKGSFFMINGGVDFMLNQITDYSLIDSLGNTENTYKNTNGNWGFNAGIMLNTPLRNNKFKFDTNTNFSFRRNVGFLNGEKSINRSYYITERLSLTYRTEKIESRLGVNYNANITKNNQENQGTRVVSNYSFSNTSLFKLPYDISIQSDMQFGYNAGYSSDFKNSEFLWNASISKQFLKQKKGTIRFYYNDILNDRNSISRMVTGTYISDSRTNMIGSYFLVSFTYRFNKAFGKSSE